MGCGVVGVLEEVDKPLFSLQSVLSQTHLCDPPCPNKCLMNSAPRSFFCSLIAISYKELLHTPVMEYVIVGVVEVNAPIFSPQLEPTLS